MANKAKRTLKKKKSPTTASRFNPAHYERLLNKLDAKRITLQEQFLKDIQNNKREAERILAQYKKEMGI
jgi:hypothetical protein